MTEATAIVPERGSIQEAQLIREQLAPKATNAEIRVFLALCERLGLDPFARQIYLVGRWDKRLRREVHTPQVSIDGFRLVAQRTREYAGQAGPEWCADDGVWRDVWLSPEPPAAARVGVYRKGWAAPLYRVALWREFVQTTKDGDVTHMWSRLSTVMIAKCAEMQALRAAFPQELSGVYGDAEMAQASSGIVDAHIVRDEVGAQVRTEAEAVAAAYDEPRALSTEGRALYTLERGDGWNYQAPEMMEEWAAKERAHLDAISEEMDAAAERGDATEVDKIAARKLGPLKLDAETKARMVRAYKQAREHAVKVSTPAPDESDGEGKCGDDA